MATNVLDGSVRNKEMEKVLLSVIESLQDGQKGFADIGEHLQSEQLKRYFLAESLKRANFRAELENELHRGHGRCEGVGIGFGRASSHLGRYQG
jgi:hypothetical protein